MSGANNPSTLGMEFESTIATRDGVQSNLKIASERRGLIYSITKDASVESNACWVGSNSSLFLGNALLRNRAGSKEVKVIGYELVTNPLEMSVMRKVINQTINTQVRMGEIYSDRSSIHVHAGFPSGLIFKKVAIAFGLKVEPLFYKIAGMGNIFRGLTNNSAYCRPLALPPAIRLVDSSRFAVLNPAKSIDAYGEERFWGYFGIHGGCRDRYVPLRYMGMNIYSTLLRGTLEYRFFNFCTISKYVESVAGFVQFISDLILRLPISIAINIPALSIFKANPNQDYNDLLDEIVNLGKYYNSELPIADGDLENIRELIEITPQPVFENRPILSHIKNGTINERTAKSFDLEIIDEADEPGIVDIHNFGRLSRQLIGE